MTTTPANEISRLAIGIRRMRRAYRACKAEGNIEGMRYAADRHDRLMTRYRAAILARAN